MRIHTALAALLLTASLLPVAASAQAGAPARLQLVVVDQTNVPVPAATVTIFTLDGNPAVTVKTDEKGVAQFPALPVGLAEIYARVPGRVPYIEKTTLQRGDNTQTVTLQSKNHES
ncbi:MAG TPA: carboxypeptidase-like regulatory domain-containing protein [Vicinamibacterales bacterium]|nr:carboxypeptidase-like regulatory domain-containing protein [Vicinamibacterales bacterium]